VSANDILLGVVVVVALGFDFTNGFHDTANAVATSVSTRAVSPRVAVLIAAIANLCDVHFGHGDIINDPARELSVSEKAPPKSRHGRGTRDEACARYESA